MEIAILACLILLNGLFAMSEVALLMARRSRLASLAAQGDGLAAAAARLAEQPTRFLSTIQIGITSIGLLNGIVGEAIFAAPLAAWLREQGLEPRYSGVIATGVVVLSITYFSIILGELVPKRLGQHNAEGIARLVAWPMRSLAWIAGPFVHLLAFSTDAVLKPLLRLLRIKPQGRRRAAALGGGDPHRHPGVLPCAAEKARLDPRQPVRGGGSHGRGRDGAARADRGDPDGRRPGYPGAAVDHQLPPPAAGVPGAMATRWRACCTCARSWGCW